MSRRLTQEQVDHWRAQFTQNPIVIFDMCEQTGATYQQCTKALLNRAWFSKDYTPPTWSHKISRELYAAWKESTGRTLSGKYTDADREANRRYRDAHRSEINSKNRATDKADRDCRIEEALAVAAKEKAAAIQPRPNPLTWWIPPSSNTSNTESHDADV